MKNERTCAICGTKYEYCNNCQKYDGLPRWMFLFHDQNCKNIYDVVNDYKSKVISAEAAKEKLSKLNLSIKLVPGFKATVDEIMRSGNEKKEKQVFHKEKERFGNFKKDK